MKVHSVRIIDTRLINYNVKRLRVERPDNYDFIPGQATEVSINKNEWKEEKRPFTFTNLPDNNFLEFTIKIYPSHEGVTNELQNTGTGEELLLDEVFGAIQYKGPGTFIAGGAGVTPFIAIFRKLEKENKLKGNKLIFGNKSKNDIFLQEEFESMLGPDFINILSEEKTDQYDHGIIDKEYIEKKAPDEGQYYYVCGPPKMIDLVLSSLKEMGVPKERIIKEDL